MHAFALIIFLLSAVIAVTAFIASAFYSRALNRYLRTIHPDIWAKVKPDTTTEPSASSPIVRFVTQRVYQQVGDPELSALGDKCYRSYYWAVSAFLALVLSGLASATFKG
jgi:hypothetical protein